MVNRTGSRSRPPTIEIAYESEHAFRSTNLKFASPHLMIPVFPEAHLRQSLSWSCSHRCLDLPDEVSSR